MSLALGILVHTPPWVFPLFALLVWLGVRALRPRVTSVGRVFITPAIFVAWGLVAFVTGVNARPGAIAIWLAPLVAGFGLAALTVRMDGLGVDRAHGRVNLPASVVPLVRNMVVFWAKYGLAVAMVLRPDTRAELALWDLAVSGASAGYFLGWAVRFALAYRRGDSEREALRWQS